MFKLNKVSAVVALAVSASFLVAACGGSSNSDVGAGNPPSTNAPAVDAQPVRSVKSLNTGWKFIQDDILTDE